jgi:RNA polymerase sigma factor (sigma-70 family)
MAGAPSAPVPGPAEWLAFVRNTSASTPAGPLFPLSPCFIETLQMKNADQRTASADDRQRLSGLLSSLAFGDRSALAELYQRTSAKLYGICLQLMPSQSEAEDVLQEVYLTVWRRAATFDPARASPITWLSVVARNKAIDQLRRARLPIADGDSAIEVEDERATAIEMIEERESQGQLGRCLEELDETQRSAIRSAFFNGSSYRQLAESSNVPLGTMKSWIRRALLRLRECLER